MSNPFSDNPPPWHVFPYLKELPRQGMEEQYVDTVWRPFWESLNPEQQEEYLQNWNASEDWRIILRMAYDPDFD